MKNRLVHQLGIAALLASLGLSASQAHAQGVQDSPPGVISFYDGRPLLGAKPLGGDDFYRLVGRPDLAEHYLRRQGHKELAVAGSLVVAGAGLIWGLGNVYIHELGCCTRVSPYPWIVAGAGLVSAAVVTSIPSDPISLDERVALARSYNVRVRLRPAMRPDGGGLIVAGSF